jgi:hypothetical protein
LTLWRYLSWQLDIGQKPFLKPFLGTGTAQKGFFFLGCLPLCHEGLGDILYAQRGGRDAHDILVFTSEVLEKFAFRKAGWKIVHEVSPGKLHAAGIGVIRVLTL